MAWVTFLSMVIGQIFSGIRSLVTFSEGDIWIFFFKFDPMLSKRVDVVFITHVSKFSPGNDYTVNRVLLLFAQSDHIFSIIIFKKSRCIPSLFLSLSKKKALGFPANKIGLPKVFKVPVYVYSVGLNLQR
jgi:hypothetical protein